ncbi:Tetracycline resistance protein, class C, partial [Armadillidium nasatum]
MVVLRSGSSTFNQNADYEEKNGKHSLYYSKHDSSGLYSLLQNSIRSFQGLLNVPEEFNSVLFGGVLGSLFSFLQFLSSPIFGALSDVYGRKPIIIFSLIGISVSYGLWFIASNFVIFVLARIIGGLCKGNVSLSYSVMTDILDPQSRSKGMALIGVAFSIGFIIGPVVGVGFSKWGTSGWFAASAFYAFALSLGNILFCSYYFQETLPK